MSRSSSFVFTETVAGRPRMLVLYECERRHAVMVRILDFEKYEMLEMLRFGYSFRDGSMVTKALTK